MGAHHHNVLTCTNDEGNDEVRNKEGSEEDSSGEEMRKR